MDFEKIKEGIDKLRASIEKREPPSSIKLAYENLGNSISEFEIEIDRSFPEEDELPQELILQKDKALSLHKKFSKTLDSELIYQNQKFCDELEETYQIMAELVGL